MNKDYFIELDLIIWRFLKKANKLIDFDAFNSVFGAAASEWMR